MLLLMEMSQQILMGPDGPFKKSETLSIAKMRTNQMVWLSVEVLEWFQGFFLASS